jgi:hypothetical protein
MKIEIEKGGICYVYISIKKKKSKFTFQEVQK